MRRSIKHLPRRALLLSLALLLFVHLLIHVPTPPRDGHPIHAEHARTPEKPVAADVTDVTDTSEIGFDLDF